MEVTAYNIPSTITDVTCTVDSRDWTLVVVQGWDGGNIRRWLNKNKDGIKGGFLFTGMSYIRFQKEEDVMFFKLSFKE